MKKTGMFDVYAEGFQNRSSKSEGQSVVYGQNEAILYIVLTTFYTLRDLHDRR